MKIINLLIFQIGLVAASVTNSFKQDKCSCEVEPLLRIDCGYYGINEAQCVNSGCCWSPSNIGGAPWCFYTAGGGRTTDCQVEEENEDFIYTCEIDEFQRQDCGNLGISQQQECIDFGCCWEPSGIIGVPWCFNPNIIPINEDVPTTTSNLTTTTTTSTTTTTTTTTTSTTTSTITSTITTTSTSSTTITTTTTSTTTTCTATTTTNVSEDSSTVTTTATSSATTSPLPPAKGIRVMFEKPKNWKFVNLWAWDDSQKNLYGSVWPGKKINYAGGSWYYYDFDESIKSVNLLFNNGNVQTSNFLGVTESTCFGLEDKNVLIPKTCPNPSELIPTTTTTRPPRTFTTSKPKPTAKPIPAIGGDFREETIYFVMTARFFDGDPLNNIHCIDDDKANNGDDDPCFRGDFKGLIDKLDYIKALGFTAIWITPVVENGSSYDYHGYHALNFDRVDPRLESEGVTYQDLINACHEKGIKIIQDIVLNHTSNNGERHIYPIVSRYYHLTDGVTGNYDEIYLDDPNHILPSDYDDLDPSTQYHLRDDAMKNEDYAYRKDVMISWESFAETTGQFAGDCQELNTELPFVYEYLVNVYKKYMDMGIDAFRIDTVKHISRLTFNSVFIPQFREHAKAIGNDDFYMFGEVAARSSNVFNHDVVQSSPSYWTWTEPRDYEWNYNSTDGKDNLEKTKLEWKEGDKPRKSTNAFLNGNNYHEPDHSQFSGLNIIDFTMHHSFEHATNAYNVGRAEDEYINDSTWNVVYVDSHDYGPNMNGNDYRRYKGDTESWAENLNLMFTFRGIPCLYYGSEIEFKKGEKIDKGTDDSLENTGRAYFGDHIEGTVTTTDFGVYTDASGPIADTLNYPLAQHIRRLNLIRRRIPALQKGQYASVDGQMAFKRRYTDDKTDSFVCVSITGGATFNGLPGGTYKEVITGEVLTIPEGGSISIPSTGKGNMRIWVLDTGKTPAPGKIGENGQFLK